MASVRPQEPGQHQARLPLHLIRRQRLIAQRRKFLIDFGMVPVEESEERIYFRGYGPQRAFGPPTPCRKAHRRTAYVYVAEKGEEREFRGGCWAVRSRDDLDRAAKMSGASAIKPLQGPGGGFEVQLRDPDGFPFRLVWGQVLSPTGEYPQPLTVVRDLHLSLWGRC